MEPIVLSFVHFFSTVTLHKTKTFLHILDNEPLKTSGLVNQAYSMSIKQKICRFEALLNFKVWSFFSPFGVCQVPFPFHSVNYAHTGNVENLWLACLTDKFFLGRFCLFYFS